MRGRKPKPTAQKKRQGNPGKRKLNTREPKPAMSTDMKPQKKPAPQQIAANLDGLAIEALVTAFAERYAPQLQALQLLTDVDHPAFEMMSLHYALAWAANDVVQRDGLKVKGVMGGDKKHPLLQVVRENSMALRAYLAEFGMTPSARSRVQAPDPDDDKERELEERFFGAGVRVASSE